MSLSGRMLAQHIQGPEFDPCCKVKMNDFSLFVFYTHTHTHTHALAHTLTHLCGVHECMHVFMYVNSNKRKCL